MLEDSIDDISFVIPKDVETNSPFNMLSRNYNLWWNITPGRKTVSFRWASRALFSIQSQLTSDLSLSLVQCRSHYWILPNVHLFPERTHKKEERVLFDLKWFIVHTTITDARLKRKKASLDLLSPKAAMPSGQKFWHSNTVLDSWFQDGRTKT